MNILDQLPNQSLLHLRKLWSVFPDARLVGGVVRDLIACNVISDIDLATPEPPELVLNQLQKTGIKAVPTGLAHGTVTAILEDQAYEITTLRKDVRTDGRHAQVCWTQKWQEDAARRDFTINAIYCDQNGTVYDYFHGQDDLAQGHVRFVGMAKTRISEDYLRILRFFRFYARYGNGQPDSDAVTNIQALAIHLQSLSAERVWSEFQKILIGPRVHDILNMMDHYEVLPIVLPFQYDLGFLNQLIKVGAPENAILRLAGLVQGNAAQIAKQFKLSNKDSKFLSNLQKPLSLKTDLSDRQQVQLRAIYPVEVLVGQSWLEQAKNVDQDAGLWKQWRERIIALPEPVFPLGGKDLMEMGIEQGPEIGKYLKDVKSWWIEQGCKASADECREWLKSHSLKRLD